MRSGTVLTLSFGLIDCVFCFGFSDTACGQLRSQGSEVRLAGYDSAKR